MKFIKIILILSFWIVLLSLMIPRVGILVTALSILGFIVIGGLVGVWLERDSNK